MWIDQDEQTGVMMLAKELLHRIKGSDQGSWSRPSIIELIKLSAYDVQAGEATYNQEPTSKTFITTMISQDEVKRRYPNGEIDEDGLPVDLFEGMEND